LDLTLGGIMICFEGIHKLGNQGLNLNLI
jgi:predicted DNA repair protein MutK